MRTAARSSIRPQIRRFWRSSSGASGRDSRSRSSRRASRRRSSTSWEGRSMTRLREAWYIGVWDSLPLLRDPMVLFILSLISFLPVFFLYLFSGGQAALPALVGAVVLSLAFVGMGVAQSVYFNKHWFRFQDILVASPVSPLSYAFGLALSTLIASSPALVLSFGILLLSRPIGPLAFLLVIAVSLLMWLAMVFVGYVIGLTTKNTRRANSIPQVLGFLLGFLPPVYYPVSLLPGFLQPVAMLVPSTHAAQLAKFYFGMIPLSSTEIVIGWVYLAGLVALMAALTLRKARWVDP